MVFFNDTATTEIDTLSLHDALPISERRDRQLRALCQAGAAVGLPRRRALRAHLRHQTPPGADTKAGPRHARRLLIEPAHQYRDRKSTRLNSSHANISYAVFCLKKKQ